MTPAEKNQVMQAARAFADIYVTSTSALVSDMAYIALQDVMFANPGAFPDGTFTYHHHGATLVVRKPMAGFVLRHFFGEG